MCGLCEGICFCVVQKSKSNTNLRGEKDVLTSAYTFSNPEIHTPTSAGSSPHSGFVLGGRKQAISTPGVVTGFGMGRIWIYCPSLSQLLEGGHPQRPNKECWFSTLKSHLMEDTGQKSEAHSLLVPAETSMHRWGYPHIPRTAWHETADSTGQKQERGLGMQWKPRAILSIPVLEFRAMFHSACVLLCKSCFSFGWGNMGGRGLLMLSTNGKFNRQVFSAVTSHL